MCIVGHFALSSKHMLKNVKVGYKKVGSEKVGPWEGQEHKVMIFLVQVLEVKLVLLLEAWIVCKAGKLCKQEPPLPKNYISVRAR